MPPISPISGAVTIHPNSEALSTAPRVPEYTDAHRRHQMFRRQRMIAARDMRNMKQSKFDDMTFDQWWSKNELADNSYIKPRTAKGDTEINMGVTRDKDNTLLALALKFDYEPAAQVFDDEDTMMQDLAEDVEDLIFKSRQIEMYRDKAKHIYRGMLTFGTQLVEELYIEQWTMEKVLKGHVGDKSASWTEKLTKSFEGCIAKPWDLRKCFPGDINKYFMNGPLGQPFFFTVEYLDYDTTNTIYGEWDMWDCVPTAFSMTPEIQTAQIFSNSWSLQPVTRYQVEIIKYYDPIANEFGVTLNGIDMLPVQEKTVKKNGVDVNLVSGFPLTAISPSGAIPFGKFDNEPMHNFFYSKSVPSKTRVIADVEDMVVKLMILGMKQMRRPPKGNKGSRVVTSDIFLPGQITNDIREGQLFDILPNQPGIQPAEFSFYEAMKVARDENSITRNFSGQGQDTNTATQAIQDKEQQMDKVALMIDGIISGEQQLFWLRTYNIFENWTKPIDQEIDQIKKEVIDKYRTVSMQKEIDGKNKAHKIVNFSTKAIPGSTPMEQSMHVHQQELHAGTPVLSNEADRTHPYVGNNEVRISYLNPEVLRSMKLTWYYTVTPMAKNNDSLGQMMFAKAIQDAMTFFGPESLNVAKLKRKYAIKYGVEYETFFVDEETLQTQQMQMQAQQPQDPNAQGVSMPGAKPTIGNMAQGAKPQVGAVMK